MVDGRSELPIMVACTFGGHGPMMRGGHGPTKLLDLNWGAFDHASHQE